MKAFLDQCGPILEEMKVSTQKLVQSKSSTQMVVESMAGAGKDMAEKLLS